MQTYRQFTAHVDAIETALVTKFNVTPVITEEWILDYIADMPQREMRPPGQIAHEIFIERTV